ncbi:GNAT family N-acetyltransferase [Aggregatilineales bacterium SYSU G02658]
MATPPVEIRALRTPDELQQAVELQKIYWGSDMSDIVPLHMLLSMANYGGHVFGAFVDGKLVGLLMGFLGAKITPADRTPARDALLVMSKRMVVLPEYRNYKIGEHLKQAQRQFALDHGVPLVTWTFDPLIARNAYLNLHKLGAVGQAYQMDFFGVDAANPTLSGDRLVANWWVAHPHVADRSAREHADGVCVGAVEAGQPRFLGVSLGAPALLLEIPPDVQALEKSDAPLAGAWRAYAREAFPALFAAGYLATDVIRRGEQTFYVFTPDDGTFTF